VPLEAKQDILALQSGEKFEVASTALVVFSTNFHPNEIFDQCRPAPDLFQDQD